MDEKFLHKVRNAPILTLEEEFQLISDWQHNQDPAHLEKLLTAHLRLVLKIAHGYKGYGLNTADLVAEGSIGMMQAIHNFDHSKGYRFATYALWWIKANMQEYILRNWSMVKMGTTSQQKKLFFRMRRLKQSFLQSEQGKTDACAAEYIAETLGVCKKEVRSMEMRLQGRDHSLNSPIGFESEGDEWIEWLEDDRDNQEAQVLHDDETRKRAEIFNRAMDILSERERLIITSRRISEPALTLEELSGQLQISRERVRQIENSAFKKLQNYIRVSSPA